MIPWAPYLFLMQKEMSNVNIIVKGLLLYKAESDGGKSLIDYRDANIKDSWVSSTWQGSLFNTILPQWILDCITTHQGCIRTAWEAQGAVCGMGMGEHFSPYQSVNRARTAISSHLTNQYTIYPQNRRSYLAV